MRTELVVLLAGLAMFASGLIMFYSVGTDLPLRWVKHVGTFVGIGGIGVVLAGILLYLISKNEPPISDLGV
ncbi:MAG: hypothetical protein D9C04_00065 [Nitrosopumilus sp. B06]|nr:MAG: hypothetical protein EB828_05580 [Nitrosopumilus sp. D6]RNJ80758.1 MAG: hypothetical protein D9C04_00065 [Nitrosopumilus sp. B06]